MQVKQFLKEAGIARGDLMRVVRALLEYSEAWQVAGHANVPFGELLDILQQLFLHQLLEFDGSQVRLTLEGEALARALHVMPVRDPTCPACAGSGVVLDQFAGARREFAPLLLERPPAISSYDQGALTADSVFQRLALMHAQGDIAEKKILLLGDDDLLSIALALTGLPGEIVVVEIDERLCAFIQEIAYARGLPIKVIRQDVREKLPPDLHARFDTFVTDPTETIQGLLLFVEKGLSTLHPGGGCAGYFGITLIEASLHKWNIWERHLLQNHAIAFTQISAPFSLYAKGTEPVSVPHIEFAPLAVPPTRPWYRSCLFRIETLSEFVPPPDYDSNPRDELYQDSESLDEVWAILARGEGQSPITIPDQFLRESAERAAAASQGLGRHVIAEFWNCENATSLLGLDVAIENAVREAQATLLDLQIRKFYPQGFSAVALLAESHLSLHAWPELGYVALDVFTCGQADPQKIVNHLENHFRPRETAYLKIPRGRARDVTSAQPGGQEAQS
ncbi:MAG: adenosylmethionine decarboxylase [Anaerolineae bacterium]